MSPVIRCTASRILTPRSADVPRVESIAHLDETLSMAVDYRKRRQELVGCHGYETPLLRSQPSLVFQRFFQSSGLFNQSSLTCDQGHGIVTKH